MAMTIWRDDMDLVNPSPGYCYLVGSGRRWSVSGKREKDTYFGCRVQLFTR